MRSSALPSGLETALTLPSKSRIDLHFIHNTKRYTVGSQSMNRRSFLDNALDLARSLAIANIMPAGVLAKTPPITLASTSQGAPAEGTKPAHPVARPGLPSLLG